MCEWGDELMLLLRAPEPGVDVHSHSAHPSHRRPLPREAQDRLHMHQQRRSPGRAASALFNYGGSGGTRIRPEAIVHEDLGYPGSPSHPRPPRSTAGSTDRSASGGICAARAGAVKRTKSSLALIQSTPNEEVVSFEGPPATEMEALLAEAGLRRLALKFETEDITPEMLQYLVRGGWIREGSGLIPQQCLV